jgi:hypothetical protein
MQLNEAILVAGHSIVKDYGRLLEDEGWFLLPFQRGEPVKYIGHIETAVRLAAERPRAALIFSGGPTRREAGPRTEAGSYWLVAEQYGWFGFPEVRERAFVEEFARDSFENLLFGICRFHEVAGVMPEQLTMVSWEFKRRRFEELHREAIGWPRERFHYLGANDPPDPVQANEAEARARALYEADPYSLGEFFQAKKAERNPFRRQHGYATSCPEMFTEDRPWV